MDMRFFGDCSRRLLSLINSEYAFPGESISSQLAKNLALNVSQLSQVLSATSGLSKSVFSFSFHCCTSLLMFWRASRIFNSSVEILVWFILKYISIFVMNSFASFRFPSKVGQVPRKLLGGCAAIVVVNAGLGDTGGSSGFSGFSGFVGAISKSSLEDSGSFLSDSCAASGSLKVKDNPVKGLTIEVRSLETASC